MKHTAAPHSVATGSVDLVAHVPQIQQIRCASPCGKPATRRETIGSCKAEREAGETSFYLCYCYKKLSYGKARILD